MLITVFPLIRLRESMSQINLINRLDSYQGTTLVVPIRARKNRLQPLCPGRDESVPPTEVGSEK